MIDLVKLNNVIIQAGAFIATFAAIAAGIVMAGLTRKFGSGILARSFKTNAIGIFLIAFGILVDAVLEYLQYNNYLQFLPSYSQLVLILVKEILFVIGTYVIVIGSKKTGDNIENLMK